MAGLAAGAPGKPSGGSEVRAFISNLEKGEKK
jgi:hypothetical protein